MADSNQKRTAASAAAAAPGGGPVLSANVPQQVSYSGQNFIELALPDTAFLATAAAKGGQG
jgi:hypothetical protein